MMKTPINADIVKKEIAASGLKSVGLASIRELNRLVGNIENASGKKFIRMEMGIPGFDPPAVAVEGEIEALKKQLEAQKKQMSLNIQPQPDSLAGDNE